MTAGKNKTILLVEDELIIALSEQKALEKYGYIVLTACSGEDALVLLQAGSAIDLVLMDIDLGSGAGGPETAQAILREFTIPIVFLSSHMEPEIVERTESITSYGYVVKSSSITALDASIKMAFKLFEANRKKQSTMDKLEATLAALPDLLYEFGLDGRYYDSHSPHVGLGHAEAASRAGVAGPAGRFVPDIFPPEAAEVIRASIREAHERGSSVGRQYHLGPAGTAGRRCFEVSASRMAGATDQPHFILLCRDITERKELEAQYLTANEMLQKVLDSIPQAICWKNAKFEFLGCNRIHAELFGLPDTKSIVGKTDWDLHRGEKEIRAFIEDDRKVMESDKPKYRIIERALYPDGRERWNETNKVPLHDPDGKVSGILIAYSDITEKMKIEEALAREKYLLNTLLDSTSDHIYFKDAEGRFFRNSRAHARFVGLSEPSDMAGKTDFDFFTKEHAEEALADEAAILETGRSLRKEESNLRPNKPQAWVLTEKMPFRDEKGAIVGTFGVSRDITERKLAEQALAREHSLLQALMDSTRDQIYFKDRDGKFIWCSSSNAQKFGLADPSEMVGLSDFDFFTAEHAQQAYDDELEIIRTGKLLQKEERETWTDKPDTWVYSIKQPLIDPDGSIVGTFGITRDISELKRNEERVTSLLREKDLILKEVHHRIKNNMSTIGGLLSLQASSLENPEAARALENAAGRVHSMLVLYEQLYQSQDFSEISVRDYLPPLVDRILESHPVKDFVSITKELDDFSLRPRTLQPLGIIVNELITNILKYAFAGRSSGRIGIYASEEAGMVRVRIEDDGNGIPEGIRMDGSSGFGLLLVGTLVQQLKGSIRIDRRQGTAVTLEFRNE
jgi:PAS domain S-box-containing protein